MMETIQYLKQLELERQQNLIDSIFGKGKVHVSEVFFLLESERKHLRKTSCNWKPKNSKSNKLRNNIREIKKHEGRTKIELRAFYRSINLIVKLDERNDLDFTN